MIEFHIEFDLSSELVHILHDRQVKIKINDIISSPFKVESGVPQGSILGPLAKPSIALITNY